MDVFVVQHVLQLPDDDEEVKLVGVYSSREAAESAIERLRLQPGFSDTPNGFCIQRYSLDKDHWTKGFITFHPGE